MTNPMNKTIPSVLLACVAILAASTADAQTVFFGAAQGGNFYGDDGGNIGDFEVTFFPDVVYNGNNGGGSVTRRADSTGSFFFANILFEGNGFGGIDQVDGNGNSGHLTNNGSTNTATFFANAGMVVGMPDGTAAPPESDDILPSGMFSQTFNPGDQIDFTVDIITNGNGGATDSAFDLGLLFDNATVPVSIGAGAIPSTAGRTTVTGSFIVVEAATTFNVVSTLTNPGTGNDQIGLDNIELSITPMVAVVGDVVRDGDLDVLDYNAIRDNFFNTGEVGSLAGEAIGAEDGVVDLDDFITFRTAFLNSGGTPQQFAAFSANVIPEPTTAVTLVCGLVFGLCRRSRAA